MHAALAHYRALLDAARRQEAALQANDFDRFLDIFAEREVLLELLDAAGLPADEPDRQEGAALARQILQIDEANAARLRQALGVTQQELGVMRGGQRLMRSYRAAIERAAQFIDRSG